MDAPTAFLLALCTCVALLPFVLRRVRRGKAIAAGVERPITRVPDADRRGDLRARIAATKAWTLDRVAGHTTDVDALLDAISDVIFVEKGLTPLPHSYIDPVPPNAPSLLWNWGVDRLDPMEDARVFVDVWDTTAAPLSPRSVLHRVQDALAVGKPQAAHPAWLAERICALAVHNGVPASMANATRRRHAEARRPSHHQVLAAHKALQDMLPPGLTVAQALADVRATCWHDEG